MVTITAEWHVSHHAPCRSNAVLNTHQNTSIIIWVLLLSPSWTTWCSSSISKTSDLQLRSSSLTGCCCSVIALCKPLTPVYLLAAAINIAYQSWADCLLTVLVAQANSAFHPFRSVIEDHLWLGGKGRQGEFRPWMKEGCVRKTVRSVDNSCHNWVL